MKGASVAQDGYSMTARPSSSRAGLPAGTAPPLRGTPAGSSPSRSGAGGAGGGGLAAGLGASAVTTPAPAATMSALPTAPPPVRPSDDDDVLTVDELVAWLRLSESTVLKLLSERAIPARKVGHQWRVRRGRVRDWLDGRE
ncbi:helix-turn-helix domain-containing protein [Frankia sp. AgPm24]|uniref:helix-turn-helix domain-containing protein n=1 Tax=Frankia TaxID=1854 RepID=UPI00200D8974|nr:helix-turn-helix domain-containing protein [Frankia sp. AgPm24]MCK9924963.1 helix-turn-helix domain-containing protein [Frankia sp. AgPm24]